MFETLPVLGKLLLSLPVELFLSLLIALTNRIALGEECGHRQLTVAMIAPLSSELRREITQSKALYVDLSQLAWLL